MCVFVYTYIPSKRNYIYINFGSIKSAVYYLPQDIYTYIYIFLKQLLFMDYV